MSLFQTFGAVAAASLLVGVPPADAQHRGGGHSRGSGGGHVASARAAAPRAVGAPRVAAPRAFGGSRIVASAPRSFSYGGPRVYAAAQRRGGAVIGHAVSRGYGPRVIVGARSGYYPQRFYRPYYAFRPRLNLGFGLFLGYPISYPYYYGYYDPYYAYGYPYPAYGYPYSYPGYGYPAVGYPAYPPAPAYPPSGYPPSAYPQTQYPQTQYPQSSYPSVSAGAPPGQANMGGVSFEITPTTAEIFVDGSFVGTVADFTPSTQPLGLQAGRHHIEIRAAGYRTMSFDADIVAGQVIPYQGTLQR